MSRHRHYPVFRPIAISLPALLTTTVLLFGQSTTDLAWGQSPFEQASLTRDDRNRQLDELAAEVSALEKQGMLLRKLVRLTTPSVVHIDAEKSTSRTMRRMLEEAGSGVIIDVDGQEYIVTNRHVIQDAPLTNVKIRLADGRLLRPTRKWEDPQTDIAVLAVAANGLVPARLGNSNAVDIGDFVLAVGSPFGLSHSVTFGIISAKGRRDLELGNGSITEQNFLQTDAAINPGNSGGPLLNLRGEVIGINTAIASSSGGSEGIGFSIPINMVTAVATQFVKNGKLTRAYLGVVLEVDFKPEVAAKLGLSWPRGALVKSITPDSPAAAGGLMEKDVVVTFDGQSINDDGHLITIVGFTQVGKAVEATVLRAGRLIPLKVVVGDRSNYSTQ